MDHRIEEVERGFREWRRSRPTRAIPDELWERAACVARVDGITKTAERLHLNATRLKERCGRTARAVGFVELAASELPFAGEFVVELEHASGSRLRLVLRGASVAAAVEVAKELWSAIR